MNKYEVRVSGYITQTLQIEAESESEARDQALDEADIFDADHSWDDAEVELIEDNEEEPEEPDPNQLTMDV